METLLEITGLSVSYATRSETCGRALNGMSLQMGTESVAVVGGSGAGKTTLALAICGLLPQHARVEAGSIVWRGRQLLGLPERELRKIRGAEIALISQEPAAALNPILCVEDQIGEVLRAHDVDRKLRPAAVRELLRRVSLPDEAGFCKSRPHEISGGQRQRVVIAQALACCPSLLIADEPTTALDTITQSEILGVLAELRATMKLAMIIISHDLHAIRPIVDRVVEVQAGTTSGSRAEGGHPVALNNSGPSRDERPPLLTARNLYKAYRRRPPGGSGGSGVQALAGVSLTIRQSMVIGLAGESGSGKTTLARCLTGLETPDSGNVLFEGRRFCDLPAESFRQERRLIQMVFQDSVTALNPWFRVEQAIAEPLRIVGVDPRARRNRVRLLANRAGLEERLLARRTTELSGGQRQRVAIARALAAEPKLMILDEPFSGLGAGLREQIISLLESLRQQFGLAILVISHDLSALGSFAGEVAVMRNGQIVEHARTAEIFSAPQHLYTRSLLAAAPQWSMDTHLLAEPS